MEACKNSNNNIEDHFGEATEMVPIGSGAKRSFKSYQLSRYACYFIVGKAAANKTHYEVGKKVRQTIKELGGTMPEDLPTPERSVKQIEREEKKKLE